jgi:hypothetical protein
MKIGCFQEAGRPSHASVDELNAFKEVVWLLTTRCRLFGRRVVDEVRFPQEMLSSVKWC